MRNKPIQKTQPGRVGPKGNLSPNKHSPSHPLTDIESAVKGNGTTNKATTIFLPILPLEDVTTNKNSTAPYMGHGAQ